MAKINTENDRRKLRLIESTGPKAGRQKTVNSETEKEIMSTLNKFAIKLVHFHENITSTLISMKEDKYSVM